MEFSQDVSPFFTYNLLFYESNAKLGADNRLGKSEDDSLLAYSGV
jgi:hypothetical protein